MGVVEEIRYDQFPEQSSRVGTEVRVCFHYDTQHEFRAWIVRDDVGSPGETILLLEDGRIVLATECQYSFGSPPNPEKETPL